MSYLPNNPYAPTTPLLPPQLGLGGPAPMNPLAAMPMPGVGFPGATPPGLPQPGIPAGLSQDAFGPAAAAGAPAAPNNQQGSVFQHPSGGLADVNQSLSGGNFWSSWKGISTIAAGLAVALYAGIAIYKGKLNIFEGAGNEHGSKAFHELTGDLKTAADKLVDNIKKAKETMLKDFSKDNADTKVADFKKVFAELKDKNLKSEVTQADYKVFEDLEAAHSAPIDKIAAKLKEENAAKLDDILKSKEVTDLEAAIEEAEKNYTAKLTAPPKADTPASAEGETPVASKPVANATKSDNKGSVAGANATTGGAATGQKGRMASILDSIKNLGRSSDPSKGAPKPQAVSSGATATATGS